jgi:hypothetical protein
MSDNSSDPVNLVTESVLTEVQVSSKEIRPGLISADFDEAPDIEDRRGDISG